MKSDVSYQNTIVYTLDVRHNCIIIITTQPAFVSTTSSFLPSLPIKLKTDCVFPPLVGGWGEAAGATTGVRGKKMFFFFFVQWGSPQIYKHKYVCDYASRKPVRARAELLAVSNPIQQLHAWCETHTHTVRPTKTHVHTLLCTSHPFCLHRTATVYYHAFVLLHTHNHAHDGFHIYLVIKV